MNSQEVSRLLDRLAVESDLCRNEGATDIADLLDDAIAAILEFQAEKPECQR